MANCAPNANMEGTLPHYAHISLADSPAAGYDADFLLIVTANPIQFFDGGGRVQINAQGWPCHFARGTHRPVVGLINFHPGQIFTE
eukprot:gene3854-3900_t